MILLARVLFEVFDILAIHCTRNLVGLPLLKCEARACVRVILVVCLILVVLDLDKV